jgi:hypothetical protein
LIDAAAAAARRNTQTERAKEIDGSVSGTKNHTRLLEIDFDCISRFVIYILPFSVCLFIRMAFVTSQYNSHCGAQKKYRIPVTYETCVVKFNVLRALVHLKLEREEL